MMVLVMVNDTAAAVAYDVVVVQRILLVSRCFQAGDTLDIPTRRHGKWGSVTDTTASRLSPVHRVSRRVSKRLEKFTLLSTRCCYCCNIVVHLTVCNVHGILITCTAFWAESCFLPLQRRPSTLLPFQRGHRRRQRTSRTMSTMLYDFSRKATTRRRPLARKQTT